MNKIFESSIDPNTLSLTVKGILLGLIPLALVVLPDVTQIELQGIVEGVVNTIIAVSVAISAIVTLLGAIRKIIVKFTKD